MFLLVIFCNGVVNLFSANEFNCHLNLCLSFSKIEGMIHPYQVNEGIEKKMVTDHKVLVKNLSKQYAPSPL